MAKLSRRRFVATGLAGAGALTVFAEPAQAQALTRYNLASVNGQAMLRKYAQAVRLMMARSPRDPLSWTFQWYTHAVPSNTTKTQQINQIFGPNPSPQKALAQAMWDTCQAHFNSANEPFFLPWHRMYVCFFEQIIRRVLNDNTFTLPYWNYSVPAGYPLPAQFRMQNDPVFGPLFRPNRRAVVNGGQPIFTGAGVANQLNPASALAQANYLPSGPGVPGFNQALDQGVHGSVHVFVGNGQGMGSVPWAANDPIFWMHHCNIDRIWVSWNNSGHTNPPVASAWGTRSFTFASANGTAVNAVVRDYTNTVRCNYRYDALIGAPLVVAIQQQLSPSVVEKLKKGPPPVIAAQKGPTPMAFASPPVTQVAAPATQGAVELGAGPVRVNLRATAPAGPTPMTGAGAPTPLTGRLNALPEQKRLYLIIDNLRATAPPETTYRVYLDLPDPPPEDPLNSHYVGSFNFFDAVPHGEDHSGHGGSKPFSFDITQVAADLQARGLLKAEHSVTIVPAGTPIAEAKPVVGDISFIEQ
jgi:tyrosinase